LVPYNFFKVFLKIVYCRSTETFVPGEKEATARRDLPNEG
jgi:hypothetical protein